MRTEQWHKVKEVYDELAVREPAERAARLNALCPEDAAICAEVEQLLGLQAEVSEFLEHPPLLEFSRGQVGKQVGAYRLLHEIGRGGMGTVYLAERADDVHRKQVAVKLVWPGFDSAEIFKRFRQERHILAELDHPNIARLLDGGTTEEGWSYVVMEYVAGEPITRFCNERKLSVTDRLKLFGQVCAAVSYAHRNLIVHRDLKPSNVLVTPSADGNAGTAKLLDFGIAKILDPALRPEALSLTSTGMQAMTPEYASPEQVGGETITTATDIYSLGVLLYELLTGYPPYRFSKRTLHEVMRVIAEEEPLRPSHVPGTGFSRKHSLPAEAAVTDAPQGDAPCAFANAHESTPDKLRRRLRGDLDNIVLKALRKEPEQRYSSVEQFSQDISCHLTGEPVIARTPTITYRVNKFVRRNKLGTAFAGFVALTLIATGSFIMWQWWERLAQAREIYQELYAAQMDQAVQKRRDFNLPVMRETIERFSTRPGEQDLRGFEWYYLWRWCNRDLFTLRHSQTIEGANVIAHSPYMVTATTYTNNGPEWQDHVWNGETATLLHDLPIGAAANSVLYYLPGGLVIQRSGKQSFRIWELGSGKEVLPAINTGSPIVSSIASCGDYPDYQSCQFFTLGEDGIVKRWNLVTGELVSAIKTDAPVRLLVLSLKHQRLVLNAGDKRLEFWDIATNRLIRASNESMPLTVANPGADANAPEMDFLYLVPGFSKRFDWRTGRELKKTAETGPFSWGRVARGRKLFVVKESPDVQITDWLTGRYEGELKGHTGWVRFVDLNPQLTTVVTASSDHTIRFWDLQTRRQLAVIPAHDSDVVSARFCRDGSRLLTASLDRTAKIWDVASLLAPDTLEGHTNYVFSVAFSPDGYRLASASKDRTIKLWDAQTGKLLNTLSGHKQQIFKIAFSPSGNRLASASEDKTVKIWDVETGRQVVELNDFTVRPRAVAFSPDGKLLAVGCDYRNAADPADGRSIRIWDAATWRELTPLKGHLNDVVAIDFSPEGKRLASASWDNTARVWDVATGRELLQFNGHKEHVWSLRFSPDGRRIATGSADLTIRIWDAATGKELLPPLKGHSRDIFGLAFSPNGKRLASGSADGSVKLWNVATGRDLVTFNDHGSEVWSVAFSPDGHTLASGSWDKTVRLYRAATEQEVQTKLSKRNSAIK